MRATILGVIGLLCVATTAQADIPGLTHIWTVGGAMQTGDIGTFVACTNANTSSETIGFERYGPAGAAVGTTQTITVAPNATVVFASSTTAPGNISVDANVGTGAFSKGHARVYSTANKGIICSAFLADYANAVPTSMVSLTIAKKKAQKGD